MKIRDCFKMKVKYGDNVSPKMWAIISSDGVPEISGSSDNMRESYFRLFETKEKAEEYIGEMEKDFWIDKQTGEKIFWFKNRKNKPILINTTLKKYRSRYVPLSVALNNFY